MRVLVTRPGSDGEALAVSLRARGIDTLHEPILTIVFSTPPEIDYSDVQGILLTSANGARALGRATGRQDLPVYAVGEATGAAARESDFTEVQVAGGDVAALAEMVTARLSPEAGVLLHPAATVVAGDLAGRLQAAGYSYRRIELYEAQPVRSLTPGAIAAIKDGSVDSVALYSPRTADVFVDLIRKARLIRSSRSLVAYCLSSAVADAISDIQWREVRIAATTTQDAFLNLFDERPEPVPSPAEPVASIIHPDDPTPPDPPPPVTAKPANSQGRMLWLSLAASIVVVGAAALTTPIWQPQVMKIYGAANDRSTEEARLVALAGRIAQLETHAKSGSHSQFRNFDAEHVRLQARLDATLKRLRVLDESVPVIEKRIVALASAATSVATKNELQRLGERLARLELGAAGGTDANKVAVDQLAAKITEMESTVLASRARDKHDNRQAFVVAVGQLRAAVREGGPYGEALAALRSLASNDATVDAQLATLVPQAQNGIARLEDLRIQFDKISGSIVRAELVPAGGGWLDRTIDRLTKSIRWRRTDRLEGNGVEAVVARAERMISTGNLGGAIAELGALPERAMNVARPWILNGQAHLRARQSLAQLQARAIAMLKTQDR